jgi:hypothetical protein
LVVKWEIEMDLLNKVLDMMAHWSACGQGIFLLLMVLIVLGFAYSFFKLIIEFILISFRGYPNKPHKCHHGKDHVQKT